MVNQEIANFYAGKLEAFCAETIEMLMLGIQ